MPSRCVVVVVVHTSSSRLLVDVVVGRRSDAWCA
jgi:hypothetical protein